MGVLVLIGAALVITAIWYGTRIQSLTIDTVRVDGGQTIDHTEIETLVLKALEGVYLGLIPQRFAWLYPKTEILVSLEEVERIHNISISRVNGTELSVTFDEYTPEVLWCMSVESDECLFLDKNGYAFGYAPKLSGGSFLRFVKIGQPATLHEEMISNESFSSLLEIVELLEAQNWYVSYIEVGQGDDSFLQIVGGGEFKVTLSQTPTETVENLFVILTSKEFQHIEPGNFQYIDLRYGNKVFVNEELAVPQGDTASSTASSSDELLEID